MTLRAIDCFHDKEREAMEALAAIYDDDTNAIMNALHSMGARLAIVAEVTPENYIEGVKYHWNTLTNAINDTVEKRQ